MNPSPTLTGAPLESLIAPITPQERGRRNEAVLALIEQWANDQESDQDQRETMDVIRQTLGPDRIASSRPIF